MSLANSRGLLENPGAEYRLVLHDVSPPFAITDVEGIETEGPGASP